jgi:DNA-directed RNA polymerase specialized sigma24 family protein
MSSSFSDSAKRLSTAFALDGLEVDRRDHERVREGLRRSLVSRFHTLGADELLDIVDEAVTRLLRESRRQSRALENPASWLVRTATNRAVDRTRILAHERFPEDEGHDDDETARLIARVVDHDMLSNGIDTAIRRGDRVCVQVVTAWLDLATETGESPSSRAVGERCGYSHTTVNNALSRFQSYLPPPG